MSAPRKIVIGGAQNSGPVRGSSSGRKERAKEGPTGGGPRRGRKGGAGGKPRSPGSKFGAAKSAEELDAEMVRAAAGGMQGVDLDAQLYLGFHRTPSLLEASPGELPPLLPPTRKRRRRPRPREGSVEQRPPRRLLEILTPTSMHTLPRRALPRPCRERRLPLVSLLEGNHQTYKLLNTTRSVPRACYAAAAGPEA